MITHYHHHRRSADGLQNRALCLAYKTKPCLIWVHYRKNDLILQPKRMIQVAMVRGLRGNWKQPIFYDFEVMMQKNLLLNIISELYNKMKYHT